MEVVFHEALGSDVEVVGRFVEEEDLGLGEEELGHRDAHLPATGKFAAVAFKVGLLEAESAEDGLNAGTHAGGIVAVELEFELADFIKEIRVWGGTGIEIGEVFFETGHFFLNGLGFSEGGFDFVIERNPGDVDAFLREVANAVVLRFIDLSGVGGEDSADTFHQSRLACAIMSGESHALLISDGEGEILENDTGSKFNAKVFDGEHGGGVVETDTIGKEFWRD